MTDPVYVIATGLANVRSVRAAMERAGAEVSLTTDRDRVANASRVVLPGVGSFGPAIERLRELELEDAIRDRIDADRPTLAICLGLQVLAEGSDEAPKAQGLGVIPGRATRFEAPLRVPQMGWNAVRNENGTEPSWFYFANSYRLTDAPDGWHTSTAAYGGEFVASIERGAVTACQFHPELSGAAGRALIERFVGGARC